MLVRLLWALVAVAFDPAIPQLASGSLATAPAYLTPVTALENAAAATVAGRLYRVEPALLLSVAWHESRYQPREVTLEVGGKVSCGVMTPEPRSSCSPASRTMLGGYLAGARHLRGWLLAMHGEQRRALLGYAGGGNLIRRCADDPSLRACQTPEVFLARAAAIVAQGRPSI